MAIVDHYLRKARIQPFMRGMIHTLILALPSIVFVIALGMVDIWADFRKLRGPMQETNKYLSQSQGPYHRALIPVDTSTPAEPIAKQ